MTATQLVLDLDARPTYRCVEGCATESADGDPHAGMTFCGRHGWWPTWRPTGRGA